MNPSWCRTRLSEEKKKIRHGKDITFFSGSSSSQEDFSQRLSANRIKE